ncbi:MAG: hypothetical protein CMK32_00665 [Porticoccaceae bacterium]|nr:hypothetical protein [Porticoccaceae bacterium]
MSVDGVISLILFLVLFFAIGLAVQSRRMPSALWTHPLIYALSFYGVSGILFYSGVVELLGRFGYAGLLGVAAYTLLFIFSPLFLEPLRWITRSNAFSSIPDLMVYRFRSVRIGKVATLTLAVSSLPIAAAQLKIIAELFFPVAYNGATGKVALMTTLCASAIGFMWLFRRQSRAQRAIPPVMAFGALLALASLLACGILAVFGVFGGLTAMNEWAEASAQLSIIKRFDTAYALILIFFSAPFMLPQLTYIQTMGRWWPRNLPSNWMPPLMFLLASLPAFPILWAGLEMKIDAPLHHYVSSLPLALNQPLIHILTLVAALFISMGMLTVTAIALGKFYLTTFITPRRTRFIDVRLHEWLDNWSFRIGALWVLAALGFGLTVQSGSVTDLTIAGMMGLSQLVPAMIATLYLPWINRFGCKAGLAVGLSIWLVSSVLPLFTGSAVLNLPWGGDLVVGPANWAFWLVESLIANLLVTLLASRLTRATEEEHRHAYRTMVDSLPVPQRTSLAMTSANDVEAKLAYKIGKEAAAREVAQAVDGLDIDRNDHRPLVLRMFRDRLGYNLSEKVGTFTSEQIMDAIMPLGRDGDVPMDDMTLLEIRLANAGSALSGLAAELNKLRLYHRQTLENLPIGVCSVDRAGEILFWNQTMATCTGIDSHTAEGGNLTDLHAPWGDLLKSFAQEDANEWPALEVENPQRGNGNNSTAWFHLQKYRVEENSPVYSGNQIILMEDITERLKLIQELAHSERLTSVGRLAAGVAHEIGNPVTGISCLAQDLQSDSADPEAKEIARMILNQTDRISTIVRTLIDFSRNDDNSIHGPTDIARAVNDAIQLLNLDRSAKPVRFLNRVPEEIRVYGDGHQLTQVFVNLLSNARDASPENSLIRIEYEPGDGNTHRFHVIDPGHGIPSELQDRVLDPFFTTKDPGDGTGLGLSLVYSIIRLHRGTLTISSPISENGGTQITLTLNSP